MAIIAYDQNRNYKKEIAELEAAGQDANALKDARAAKVTSADAATKAKWGLTADEISEAENRVNGLSQPKVQTPVVQDFSADIAALQEAQRAARVAALSKARDSSLSALNAEQTTIAPQYYDKRNQEGATSEMNKRNFAEYMAQRGIGAGSGSASEMEISRMGALQGNIGTLNRQEQAAQDDVARRKTGVESEYQWGVAQAGSEIDAQAAAARIAEMQRVQELGLQQSNADRQFNLQEQAQTAALAAQALDTEIKQYQIDLMKDPNSIDNKIKATQYAQYQFELKQAMELAKYAPIEAQAKIDQIKASIRASNASVANATIDNNRQADNVAYERFMTQWQALGYAPANDFGITPGSPYAPGMKTQTAANPTDRVLNKANDLQTMLDGITDEYGDVKVAAKSPAQVIAEIDRMISLGALTIEEADILVANNPTLSAYAQEMMDSRSFPH